MIIHDITHVTSLISLLIAYLFIYLGSRSFLIKTLALGSTHVRWHWSDLPEAMGSGASVGARILSSDHDYIGEVDWSYLDLPGIYVEHNLDSSSYQKDSYCVTVDASVAVVLPREIPPRDPRWNFMGVPEPHHRILTLQDCLIRFGAPVPWQPPEPIWV